MVKVCIGSKNQTKLRGIEKAFRDLLGYAEIVGYNIESIIKQPIGLEITIDLAKYRARKVMEIDPSCDFYVGNEAGLIEINGLGHFDIHVTCIIDKNSNEFYGFSPAFMIPKNFVDRILSGEFKELEEIVDSYFGTKNIGEKGGFINLLTKGIVTREDLVYHSVVAALIPIINKTLYFPDNTSKSL
ncbi:MAG: inosine/xanthosine triphosphatase [Ignisphaera sp.]